MLASFLTLPLPLVYGALFGLVAGESAGLPIPGETSLIAAGVLASQHGRVSIVLVILVAASAAIAGDNVGFVIGRRGGRWLLERDGRWLAARRRLLERGEAFFARHGPKTVFLGRWLPGLRVTAALLAGANRMRWRTFLAWNALGGIGWAVSVGLGAFLLGQAAARLFRTAGLVGLGAVVLAAVAALVWHVLHRRRRRTPLSPPRPAGRAD